MKKRCRTDLSLFAYMYFPLICRLSWSNLHRYLFRRRGSKCATLPPDRVGSIDVVMAPRGAAKSTLVSLVFPIHAIVYRTDPYIILISATQRQAAARLANIRDALAAAEKLQEHFYDELSSRDVDSNTTIVINKVKIDAFSVGSELRGLTFGGWRPTWIILDDVESGARVLSSSYRRDISHWMAEVIENLGNGYTNIDLIGTLLHREALPASLAHRPDVTDRTFRSIMREADDQDRWEQWRARLFDLADPDRLETARDFFEARRPEMLSGASVLWSDKETYYDLQVMRATRGRAAFDKEKQNEPLSEDASFFSPEAFRRFELHGDVLVLDPGLTADRDDASPRIELADLRLFGFLDPAAGGAKTSGRHPRGDFASIATVGVDLHGYLFLLDLWLERVAPSAQVQRIFDLHERWGYSEFGIETNAFQSVLLEPVERERGLRRQAARPWDLPVHPVRHRIGKNQRIMALEPLIRSGWLLFPRDLPEPFLDQLTDFPHGHHDDGPDALAAAVVLARASTRSLGLSARQKSNSPSKARGY